MPTRLLRRAWRRWSLAQRHPGGPEDARARSASFRPSGTASRYGAAAEVRDPRASMRRPCRLLRCCAETGAIAFLRRDRADSWVLHEVFGKCCYEPPAEATDILARVPRPRIVDVGAHVGFFGLLALARHPSARIIAIEPDPANAPLLQECIPRQRMEWPVGTDRSVRLRPRRFVVVCPRPRQALPCPPAAQCRTPPGTDPERPGQAVRKALPG